MNFSADAFFRLNGSIEERRASLANIGSMFLSFGGDNFSSDSTAIGTLLTFIHNLAPSNSEPLNDLAQLATRNGLCAFGFGGAPRCTPTPADFTNSLYTVDQIREKRFDGVPSYCLNEKLGACVVCSLFFLLFRGKGSKNYSKNEACMKMIDAIFSSIITGDDKIPITENLMTVLYKLTRLILNERRAAMTFCDMISASDEKVIPYFEHVAYVTMSFLDGCGLTAYQTICDFIELIAKFTEETRCLTLSVEIRLFNQYQAKIQQLEKKYQPLAFYVDPSLKSLPDLHQRTPTLFQCAYHCARSSGTLNKYAPNSDNFRCDVVRKFEKFLLNSSEKFEFASTRAALSGNGKI